MLSYLSHLIGFNYAYRRTATPSTVAPTPTSPAVETSTTPIGTKGPTPVPPEKGPSARASPAPKPNQSSAPETPTSGRETPKDQRSAEKAEKERAKRERKKERKQQEKAEREAAAAAGGSQPDGETNGASSPVPPQSGKATPELSINAGPSERRVEDGIISPATESTGARTPTSRRPQRNPWTIFMRMPEPAGEQEVREFFGEARSGVSLFLDLHNASVDSSLCSDHES